MNWEELSIYLDELRKLTKKPQNKSLLAKNGTLNFPNQKQEL